MFSVHLGFYKLCNLNQFNCLAFPKAVSERVELQNEMEFFLPLESLIIAMYKQKDETSAADCSGVRKVPCWWGSHTQDRQK